MAKKDLFTPGDVHGNVCLSTKGGSIFDFIAYADSYKDAAIRLTLWLEDSAGYSDFDACPIAFLLRHALELYFKSIILLSHDLLSIENGDAFDKKNIFREHNLKNLYNNYIRIVLEKILSREWPSDWEGVPSEEKLLQILTEFDEIDRDSTAFRYPLDNMGKSRKTKGLMFDVVKFARELEKLCDFLESLYDEISAIQESYTEYLSEN
jgi:hypothetical protein